MADEMDRLLDEAREAVVSLLVNLGSVLLHLPIPVELPNGFVEMSEIVFAVERAAALSEFEPMPEEHKDELRGGCIMWLCAVSLLGAYNRQHRPFQLLGVFRCLENAREQLLALAEFLMPEEDGES